MNYVNEQNMQEILDGIARKIGTGGGSGAGLEDWQSEHTYSENDIFVYEGQIYKSIVDFESDSTFNVIQILEEYTLQGGETPIAYAQGTDIVVDDIVSYDSNYYKALYDFTCGEAFGLYAFEQYTPKELTTEQENAIIQHWEENLGGGGSSGGSGITKTILYEGTDQISAISGSSSYNLSSSLDNYDFVVLRIIGHYSEGTDNGEYVLDKPIYKPYGYSDNSAQYNFLWKSQADGSSNFSGWFSLSLANNTITVALREKASTISYIYLASVTGYKYKSSGGGNTSNNYSTTEQVVGMWIDGKPLYQITIQDTMPTVSSSGTRVTKDIDISHLSIDKAVSVQGIILASKSNTPLNSVNNLSTSSYSYGDVTQENSTTIMDNLYLVSTRLSDSNQPVYITIQYTKTTD